MPTHSPSPNRHRPRREVTASRTRTYVDVGNSPLAGSSPAIGMTTTFAVRRDAESELAAILTGDTPTLPSATLRQLATALRYDADQPPAWADDIWKHPGWRSMAAFIGHHFPSAPHPELLVVRALQSAGVVRVDPDRSADLLSVLARLKTRSHPVERPQTDLVKKLTDQARTSPAVTPRDHERDPRQAVGEMLNRLKIDAGPNTKESVLTSAAAAVGHVERVLASRKGARPGVDSWATFVNTSQLAGNSTSRQRPGNAFPSSSVKPELTALYFGIGYRHRVKTESRPAFGLLWWLAKPDFIPPSPVVRRWKMSIQRMEAKLDTSPTADILSTDAGLSA